MVDFTIEQIKEATGAVPKKTAATTFSGIVTDTRQISAGCLFVALKGERFDGHAFAAKAVEAGAAGVLASEKIADVDATVLEVSDTLLAYQDLARAYRKRFSIPIVAITGSNGKTTTKDLTSAALSGRWNVLKTEANFNNEIGLPLTLLGLEAKHQAAVVEMGMRGFGQIEALAKIAQPTIGIVTNVGETHMELLGSLENIAKAKAELVEMIEPSGTVILNADNAFVLQMREKAKAKVVTFGIDSMADVMAKDIHTVGNSMEFSCSYGKTIEKFVLPMVGRHNIYNGLAAITTGFVLGLSAEEIQQGLDGFEATKMRFEYKKVKEYHVINDAYNASPMSMTAAIETLAEVAKGRKIAVMGDMLELGNVSKTAHEQVGRELAAKGVDALLTRGEMGKYIAEAAKAAGLLSVYSCDSHADAAKVLQKILQPGDTILFKGSRGMQMEKIIDLL